MISFDEFANLELEDQVARIKNLGLEALREFGVEADEIQFLAHAENTSFRIVSSKGVFNLRISRPDYQTATNIRSELMFLGALGKAGFNVPQPWKERMLTIEHPDVPQPRHCVLFRWLDGEFALGRRATPECARDFGRLIAEMHNFSACWTPPADFDRAHIHAWAFAPREPLPIDEPTPLAYEEDRLLLVEAEREARDLLSHLPRDPAWYGLIHADFLPGNVLIQDSEFNILDFDDCGYGFWLYDLAAALEFAVHSPMLCVLQEAMFSGYAEIRQLPKEALDLRSRFLQLRLFRHASWVISRRDNPAFRDTGAEFVHDLCEKIRVLRR
jgi:Ser/Thr protein kinase RdoA (MazF antagonist)